MDVHQRYSVSAYRRKIASERSKANISVKYQVRTAACHFSYRFGNNLMFQLKLRKDDAGDNRDRRLVPLTLEMQGESNLASSLLRSTKENAYRY